MTRTVDLTPTWAGILPALFAALEYGTAQGQAIAKEELSRLARAMDSRNAQAKAEAAALADLASYLDPARAFSPAADLAPMRAALALVWTGPHAPRPHDPAPAEALDLARAFLAAYGESDIEGEKNRERIRDMARDSWNCLSALVAAFDPAPEIAPAPRGPLTLL